MKTRLVTYDDVEYGDIFTREGFGFAPIGTIIYRDGNVVPNGFLLCDGSTKSISSYPDLATYFQTTHGSKNYYGGNGTSTFGLPSIRRMPGNVSHEFSETEKCIGTFTDNKPLYRKVLISTIATSGSAIRAYSSIPNSDFGWVENGFYINNVSNTTDSGVGGIMDINSTGRDTNTTLYDSYAEFRPSTLSTNGGQVRAYFSSGSGSKKSYMIVCYTKSTDSAVPAGYSPDRNGIWCIKATTDPTN